MRSKLDLPKFLDILILLDEQTTYTKIYKGLPKSTGYIVYGLHYLRDKGLITMSDNPCDARALVINLTDKGADAQRMVITLYGLMGIRRL